MILGKLTDLLEGEDRAFFGDVYGAAVASAAFADAAFHAVLKAGVDVAFADARVLERVCAAFLALGAPSLPSSPLLVGVPCTCRRV